MREEVERLANICRDRFGEKDNLEDVLLFLRQETDSKTISMGVIKRFARVSLGEAKRIVHFSKTWQDRERADADFHDSLIDEMENSTSE